MTIIPYRIASRMILKNQLTYCIDLCFGLLQYYSLQLHININLFKINDLVNE